MPEANNRNKLADRTVADFGDQWQRYTDNEGYYGSVDLLADTFGPLLRVEELNGLRIADIGSGTGRIVRMLLDGRAAHVTAVEPSQAFAALVRNVASYGDKVATLNVRGDQLPAELGLDLVVSIGVIHHIPDPAPVLRAAYAALRPGGRCLIWLYGAEGNASVVSLIKVMRMVTTHLPHWALAGLAQVCTVLLDVYAAIARVAPIRLPLRDYIENVIGKFSRRKRYLVIYDQLKPAYAKYYREEEARRVLEEAGFTSVRTYHRRGYSWTVIGTKPSSV